ncbi:MAG: metal-sensing transcriptional repressor [Cyanobacteria bacterium P01_H01_bin.121]
MQQTSRKILASQATSTPQSGTAASHTQSAKAKTPSAKTGGHGHAHGHGHEHGHVHDPESMRRLINRLSRIEGHVRGIKVMLQENRPCPEVLVQVAAIRGALNKVSRLILDEHLTECIARASHQGDIEVEIAELKEALDHFL